MTDGEPPGSGCARPVLSIGRLKAILTATATNCPTVLVCDYNVDFSAHPSSGCTCTCAYLNHVDHHVPSHAEVGGRRSRERSGTSPDASSIQASAFADAWHLPNSSEIPEVDFFFFLCFLSSLQKSLLTGRYPDVALLQIHVCCVFVFRYIRSGGRQQTEYRAKLPCTMTSEYAGHTWVTLILS